MSDSRPTGSEKVSDELVGLTEEGVSRNDSSSSVFVAGLAVGGVESIAASSNGVAGGVIVEGVDSIVSSSSGWVARRLRRLLLEGVDGSFSSSKGLVAARLDTVVEAECLPPGRPAKGASDVAAGWAVPPEYPCSDRAWVSGEPYAVVCPGF